MSIQEKKTVLNMTSGWVIFVAYAFYLSQNYSEELTSTPVDIKFWASAFLILIPVSIVARIIIHIIFAIVTKVATDEDLNYKEDERDKMIQLRSVRNSMFMFAAGFLLSMVAVVMDAQPYMMFVIIAIGGLMAETMEGLTALYYYRRGF